MNRKGKENVIRENSLRYVIISEVIVVLDI